MKKSLYVLAATFVFMVFLCWPQKGSASLITLHFMGEVTSMASTSSKYSWETAGYFKAGDLFEGYYSYQDDQQAFGWSNPAESGSYAKYYTEAVTFSAGNVAGAASSGYLFVYDGYSNTHKDQYGFWTDTWNDNLTGSGYPHAFVSFSLGLYDSTETAFDSSALPLTAPDLDDFTSTQLVLRR